MLFSNSIYMRISRLFMKKCWYHHGERLKSWSKAISSRTYNFSAASSTFDTKCPDPLSLLQHILLRSVCSCSLLWITTKPTPNTLWQIFWKHPLTNILKFCSHWTTLNWPIFNVLFSISTGFNLIFQDYRDTKEKVVFCFCFLKREREKQVSLMCLNITGWEGPKLQNQSPKTTCLKLATYNCASNPELFVTYAYFQDLRKIFNSPKEWTKPTVSFKTISYSKNVDSKAKSLKYPSFFQ